MSSMQTKKFLYRRLLTSLACIFCMVQFGYADKIHELNSKANSLYKKGKYEEALALYEDALVRSPADKKLGMNKAAAQYQFGDFETAEATLRGADSLTDKKTMADLHYNLGNILYRQGEQMEASGGEGAMDKFKASRDEFIKSLDLKNSDRDSKWNLQMAQQKIKQMEQQQNKDNKDQDKDKKDQDKKDQDKKQDSKDKKDQDKKDQDKKDQDKKDQDKKDQDKNSKDDQDKKDQDKKDQDKKEDSKDKKDQDNKDKKEEPQPSPQQKEKEMKQQEAKRLIEQFSDDAKELNKPKKQIGIIQGKSLDQDW